MMVAGDDSAAKKNDAGESSVVAADHLACDQGVQFVCFEFFELCGGWHRSSWAKLVRKNRVSKPANRQWVRGANRGNADFGRVVDSGKVVTDSFPPANTLSESKVTFSTPCRATTVRREI